MSQIVIAPLQHVHVNACLLLWPQAGMAHEPDLLDRLTRLLAHFPNLSKVALVDGQVVGCVLCSYNEFSLYVFRLVVDPAYRGGGIGKRLMEECERSAHAIGAAKVM